MDREKLYNRVKKISKLSTLPVIAAQVIALVENPKTSAQKLGRVISTDQALTSRILKLANSAYYGFPRKISTLNLAIVVLGFNTLKDLVLSISILENFQSDNDKENLFDATVFWEHSLTSGLACKLIADDMHLPIKGEAFVAGLLHNIGVLSIYEYFPEQFKQIVKIASAEKINILEAEKKVLGVTHAVIGGWLVENWFLPDVLVEAITYHHEPLKIKGHQKNLASVVYFSDILCALVGKNFHLEKYNDLSLNKIALVKQKLFPQSMHPIEYYIDKLTEEVEKASSFFELISKENAESAP